MSANDIIEIIWGFFGALFVYRFACGMLGLEPKWVQVDITINNLPGGEE